MVNRTKEFYNLDTVLSVGYRVKSDRGVKFRQWANRILKEYLLKGYAVNNRIERLEHRVTKTEEKIDLFVRTSLPPMEGIFFDGQIFDAYTFVSDLIRSARKSIVLFDNYVDDTVLTMPDKRKSKVTATIYTQKGSMVFILASPTSSIRTSVSSRKSSPERATATSSLWQKVDTSGITGLPFSPISVNGFSDSRRGGVPQA